MKREIGILVAGENLPALATEFGQFADWFVDLLTPAEPGFRFRKYHALRGDLPAGADACDAYIVTGSAAGVMDGHAWIEDLEHFARRAALSRPVLGVCFGHQLLHQAMGGRVETSDRGWGIGLHRYRVQAPNRHMPPGTEQVHMAVSHRDQVVEPAPGTTILAGNDHCPAAITAIGDTILTVQGHPEFSAEFSTALYRHRQPVLGDHAVQRAITSLQGTADNALMARWFGQFLAG